MARKDFLQPVGHRQDDSAHCSANFNSLPCKFVEYHKELFFGESEIIWKLFGGRIFSRVAAGTSGGALGACLIDSGFE